MSKNIGGILMENNQLFQSNTIIQTNQQTLVSSFFAKTYAWMFLSLILTAVSAISVAFSPQLATAIIHNSVVFYSIIAAQLIVVLILSFGINKMPVGLALFMLFLYAAITGVTLSTIFYVFSLKTIGIAFFASALIYGIMALYGTFTKSNLSPIASFLFIGLLGGIIISFINILILHSSTLDTLISLGLVLIFAGLTAYDHQKLKEYALNTNAETSANITRASIFGALQLYLDFINLFLLILRLLDKN